MQIIFVTFLIPLNECLIHVKHDPRQAMGTIIYNHQSIESRQTSTACFWEGTLPRCRLATCIALVIVPALVDDAGRVATSITRRFSRPPDAEIIRDLHLNPRRICDRMVQVTLDASNMSAPNDGAVVGPKCSAVTFGGWEVRVHCSRPRTNTRSPLISPREVQCVHIFFLVSFFIRWLPSVLVFPLNATAATAGCGDEPFIVN